MARELERLFQASQLDRKDAERLTPEEWKDVFAREQERCRHAAEMVQSGQVVEGEDYYYAASILERSPRPEDVLLAHVLATAAALKGYEDARWLSAAALDKYLHAIRQPQVFGTSYQGNGRGHFIQEPMLAGVPDTVRTLFEVLPRAEQSAALEELNVRLAELAQH